MIRARIAATWLLLVSGAVEVPAAGKLDYALEATQVAPDVYAVLGRLEHFSRRNGGNIVNTGFIVTKAGVVVIDTGPSRLYGESLRRLIASKTSQPVVRVFNTHLHPDHILGNQAFEDVPLSALPATVKGIRHNGEAFTDALYAMTGDWMRGTELTIPGEWTSGGTFVVGGRVLEVLELAGHSAADLALYDVSSGVLFAGDLAFLGRAPTTPHATLERWQASLDVIAALKPLVVVPGHGPVDTDGSSITMTRAYLAWLHETFEQSAAGGFDMNEVMQMRPPVPLDGLAVLPEEFHRSVAHLFPGYEQAVLGTAKP